MHSAHMHFNNTHYTCFIFMMLLLSLLFKIILIWISLLFYFALQYLFMCNLFSKYIYNNDSNMVNWCMLYGMENMTTFFFLLSLQPVCRTVLSVLSVRHFNICFLVAVLLRCCACTAQARRYLRLYILEIIIMREYSSFRCIFSKHPASHKQ